MYISTDDEGRILASTTEKEYAEGMTEWDAPDDFDVEHQDDYLLKDGVLTYSPRPLTEGEVAAQKAARMSRQRERAAEMFVRASASTLSDEEALEVSELFLSWEEDLKERPDTEYAKGDVRRYGEDIYRYISDSPTKQQASWTPDQAHSLWVRIKADGIAEWEPKVQGKDELYQEGDRVTHNGKTWVSKVPNNIWEPGVYGWDEVKE